MNRAAIAGTTDPCSEYYALQFSGHCLENGFIPQIEGTHKEEIAPAESTSIFFSEIIRELLQNLLTVRHTFFPLCRTRRLFCRLTGSFFGTKRSGASHHQSSTNQFFTSMDEVADAGCAKNSFVCASYWYSFSHVSICVTISAIASTSVCASSSVIVG